MRAMVLAAGLGTRLLPLTRLRPKCLMPVCNRPLLGLWLERLAALGVTRAVVNSHHLAHAVRLALPFLTPPGLEALESHEPTLLGSGGGLVAARAKLGDEPFLLANADVLAAADPLPLLAALRQTGAAACLGLVDWPEVNSVAVGPGGRVRGFYGDIMLAPERWLTYSGVAAISPELFEFLPTSGPGGLVEALRAALRAGRVILGLELGGYWSDLGAPERYLAAHRDLLLGGAGFGDLAGLGPMVVAPGAVIEPGARLEGFCAVAEGARVAAGALVSASVLLPGARVAPGATVFGAVLGDGFVASGELRGGAHA